MFAAIRQGDILVQHPYESFAESVEAFITQASRDPDVLAIKQTLYRTSGDSPIVRALIRAAEQGKQVAALVELKARGDEAANIGWARALEEAGVHVVYGLVGLKTHSKTVAGGAPGGRRHPPLLPHRHRQLQLQHRPALRGHRHPHRVARDRRRPHRPVQLPDRLQPAGRIPPPAGRAHRAAAAHARADPSARRTRASAGRIVWKLNNLVDPGIIDALYRASQAGVRIDLLVRAICCLRPGCPGPLRQHPGAQHRGPLAGALADLLLRRRRRASISSARPT